jgi:hypothetical protein
MHMTEVETAFAIDLRNRRDPHYANSASYPQLVTRPSMQRLPCWGVQDKIDMIDTVLRGWICPPIYMISRPMMTEKCKEGEDHVFDGAHKLEAVFEFIDDTFPFKSKSARFADINGKTFSEMPKEIQDRIKKYRFHINHVDAETASSPDELRILWERVNKSGKKLNSYELDLPITSELNELVLKPAGDKFYGTTFFPKKVSSRGDMERRLELLLAVSETDTFRPGATQSAIIRDWQTKRLGKTMAERTEHIKRDSGAWIDILDRCFKMLHDLEQLNVFSNDDGDSILSEAHRVTELPFLLARLTRKFPRIEEFRSQKRKIAESVKDAIFRKSVHELGLQLGNVSRNGTYQPIIIKYIDTILSPAADNVQPRFFTMKQKKEKLKEQNGLCVLCQKKILSHQLSEGDHIVEWSNGGETTMENLQILHKVCHEEKTASAASV